MEQDKHNSTTSSELVGALARKNHFSVDSFCEIAQTRYSVFEGWTEKFMRGVKHGFTNLQQNVHNVLKSQNDNSSAQQAVQANKAKNGKAISRKQSKLRREEEIGGFLKVILKDRGFWILSAVTVLTMGLWTHVVWVLVRRRVVELTDLLGGILKYFGSYLNGVPALDVVVILSSGTMWAFAFFSIYILMYSRHYVLNASPDWKRKESWWVVALILFEAIVTVYSINDANLSGLTNKQISDLSWTTVLFEVFPFIAFWLLFHFLVYKNWIAHIRNKAGKVSGEIYLMEIREGLNKLIYRKKELDNQEIRLNATGDSIEQEKAALKNRILAYQTAEHDILTKAEKEKNAVIDFGQKWLAAAYDDFMLRGEASHYGDYEIVIKNVIKRITDAVDAHARKCSELVDKYQEKASDLMMALDGNSFVSSTVTIKLLPSIMMLFSIVMLPGCVESAIFHEKNSAEADNIVVALDLSDRFLNDHDSLYLPVVHDLAVIESVWEAWEQEIINKYDQGIDVRRVEGAFSVVSIPMPHESRRSVSALGLCIELSDLPAVKRWDHIAAKKDSVMQRSRMIYKTALQHEPAGADIWAFFRDLQLYLKPSGDSLIWSNRLILLTDGYAYIDKELKKLRRSSGYQRDYLEEGDMHRLRKASNWEDTFLENQMGFLPIGKMYSNLDVLVIGLNEPLPFQGSATELSIIERYWIDFFEDMGIKSYSFVRFNSPAVRRVIRDFLNSR